MMATLRTAADPRTSFVWDTRTRQYRQRASGRFVSRQAIRNVLDKALQQETLQTQALARSLQAGEIGLDQWTLEMQDMVKRTHLYSAALARGGWAQLTDEHLDEVGQRVRFHFDHLEAFVDELAIGVPPGPGFVTRATMYSQGGRTTYESINREEQEAAGANEERNVLDQSIANERHCDDCPAATKQGWVPKGTLSLPGTRQCLTHCHCRLEYRKREAVVGQGPEPGPALTDADILAQPASAYPPARPGERETLNAFTTADGQLTPERQQLHDAIMRQHFQGATPVADPTVYVMGGGPGAGKSVMLDKLNAPSNVVTIDPDRIKTLLPEFREGVARGDANAGTMIHEESSAIAKRIVAEAASGRYQIVVDGTGDNSYENLAKKVAGYRAGGAKIVANYVTVDTDTAVARAHSRGVRTGRFIPETFLREVHRNISAIVPRAVNEGLFDDLTIWDNNGAAGAATVIARYTGGRLTVLDEALWQRFLLKAA